MAEYIDRDVLIADFEALRADCSAWTPERVSALIRRQPVADPALIMGCKECRLLAQARKNSVVVTDEELVATLNYCGNSETASCDKCPMHADYDVPDCLELLMSNAAAAIERLRAELEQQRKGK